MITGNNFCKKGVSSRQQKKNEHNHRILYNRNSRGTKFHLKERTSNLQTKFAQKGISGLIQKKGTSQWVLYIRISLGDKFYLKQTILNYWTKFGQKGYFQSKTEKFIIEFSIFRLD